MSICVECPSCGEEIRVGVGPVFRGTKWEPPDGPEFEVLTGCEHAEEVVADHGVQDRLLEMAGEESLRRLEWLPR